MRIVVLTGAGVSRESGLETFRDGGGLWEGHDPMAVATPEALAANPELVHRFYDERRRNVREAEPNAAHRAIAALEQGHTVDVITQNIDDLHERGGSTHVLHLHGEILKARTHAGGEPIAWHDDLPPGELRPHVVFFGEAVPAMGEADALVRACDLLLIVGTSLQVYPAAGLATVALRLGKRVVLVDPRPPAGLPHGIEVVPLPAT
ncbi:NAD-dependent deacylase, partial [bacterium]